MTKPSEALAALLRQLRQRQRVAQKELGDLAGLSRTLIVNLERGADQDGRPPNPRPDTLRRLARGLATDGAGNLHKDDEERFYVELMVAAGHLAPSFLAAQHEKPWTMREALRGHLPENLIDQQVERYADSPLADQQAACIDIIAMYQEAVREASERMLKQQRRDRPA